MCVCYLISCVCVCVCEVMCVETFHMRARGGRIHVCVCYMHNTLLAHTTAHADVWHTYNTCYMSACVENSNPKFKHGAKISSSRTHCSHVLMYGTYITCVTCPHVKVSILHCWCGAIFEFWKIQIQNSNMAPKFHHSEQIARTCNSPRHTWHVCDMCYMPACVTVCCSVVQCVAVCYNVLLCVAVCCSVL